MGWLMLCWIFLNIACSVTVDAWSRTDGKRSDGPVSSCPLHGLIADHSVDLRVAEPNSSRTSEVYSPSCGRWRRTLVRVLAKCVGGLATRIEPSVEFSMTGNISTAFKCACPVTSAIQVKDVCGTSIRDNNAAHSAVVRVSAISRIVSNPPPATFRSLAVRTDSDSPPTTSSMNVMDSKSLYTHDKSGRLDAEFPGKA